MPMRAGEVAGRYRTLAALEEALGVIPSTQVSHNSQLPVTPASPNLLCTYPHADAHTTKTLNH